MSDKLDSLLAKMRELEVEMMQELRRKEADFLDEVRAKKVRFTKEAIVRHRMLSMRIHRYLLSSSLLVVRQIDTVRRSFEDIEAGAAPVPTGEAK